MGACLQNIEKKGPCGHIKGALLQNNQNKNTCGHIKEALLQNIEKKRSLRTAFRRKIQFHPPKGPLRDAFRARHTILSAQKAPAGRLSVIPKPKYMTLGPKFYTKLVSSITRRRKKVRRNEVHF